MSVLVRETGNNTKDPNRARRDKMKKNKKMKKVSGNPQKRAEQMKAPKLSRKAQLRFVRKSFEKACNVPVAAPLLVNLGDGLWTYSPECDNNAALNFMKLLDPNFLSIIKSGEMTTELQLHCCRGLRYSGHKHPGDALAWNRFQVNELDGKVAIRGRWWAMKGDEFNKAHKDIPMTFSADDVIVCDVCPEQ